MTTSEALLSNAELAQAYADIRTRCLAIAATLSDSDAEQRSACCPAWSVRGLYAHMAGVPVDIIEGNTEGAATEPWADAHVERRADDTLAQICAEWAGTADHMDQLLSSMGNQLPPQFFIDAWTHEWDIRQATAVSAIPDLRLVEHTLDLLVGAVETRAADHQAQPAKLILATSRGPRTVDLGDGSIETVSMDLFEFARVTMGRRSEAQIVSAAPGIAPTTLVLWTANDQAIVDPVET